MSFLMSIFILHNLQKTQRTYSTSTWPSCSTAPPPRVISLPSRGGSTTSSAPSTPPETSCPWWQRSKASTYPVSYCLSYWWWFPDIMQEDEPCVDFTDSHRKSCSTVTNVSRWSHCCPAPSINCLTYRRSIFLITIMQMFLFIVD